MKFGKVKETDGYILLEALISLSILVFLLAGTMPYLTDVFEVRYHAKSEVEISRLLYETALFWERKESATKIISGKTAATSLEDANKIVIRGEDGYEKKVEILSVKWAE